MLSVEREVDDQHDDDGMEEQQEVVIGMSHPPDNTNPMAGTSLSWRDITYRVPRRKRLLDRVSLGRRGEGDHEKLTLLDRVSGCVPAGMAVAVMGPSGCGKSTLLDVLAGRISKGSDLTGEILVNGVPMKRKAMKGLVAYVMQDDALQGVLTVRENLLYSALLRLPGSPPGSGEGGRGGGGDWWAGGVGVLHGNGAHPQPPDPAAGRADIGSRRAVGPDDLRDVGAAGT